MEEDVANHTAVAATTITRMRIASGRHSHQFSYLCVRESNGRYRIHIRSRFETGEGRGPAGIARVRVAERGGRDGEVVRSHTLMYRFGSEGRIHEGR